MAPPVTSGLVLQFDADDFAGQPDGTAIGESGVTPWNSQVGTSSGTQGTAGFRPTKQTFSGQTVVRFDGTDDRLPIAGDALTATQNVGGLSIFVKAKLNSLPVGSTSQFISFSAGSAVVRARLAVIVTTNLFVVSGRRLAADSLVSVGTATPGTTAIQVFTGIIDYANSDAFAFIDGVASGSSTSFQADGNTENTASLTAALGSQFDSAGYTACDMQEVLVYNRAVDTSERTQIESYLAGTLRTVVPAWRITSSNQLWR